jgi:poly-gamma-glutamate synthase PgsB/CapB
MLTLLLCLLVLLALGAAERLARDCAWRDIPIRIHVNGTRAKSTVTRLIWSALREAGIPAFAKTTGAAARMLLPDGSEEPVRRRGPANVREQLACLRLARRARARAVVFECMALDPVLQAVSERDMIGATIGVITNVRFDHSEIMGTDLPAIASTLANTIPARGILVTGAVEMAPLFRERAAALRTRVVVAGPPTADGSPAGDAWMTEDQSLALAVTRELGIEDSVARRGFSRAPRDPGTVTRGTVDLPGGPAAWMDATSANDPESLALLLNSGWRSDALPAGRDQVERRRILVYNHRDDRVPRLIAFAERCDDFRRAHRLVITGARPPWTVSRQLSRLARPSPAQFIAARVLAGWVRMHAAGTAIAFCGNARGLDVPRLLEEAASGD